MNKFKLFIENLTVYGVGGVIVKIIPLIMLPIITRLLPNSEYFAANDLFQTLSSFAGAIALLGMYDAMYRLYFDNSSDIYKRSICSTTFYFVVSSTLIVSAALIIFRNFFNRLLFGSQNYTILVLFSALYVVLNGTSTIISGPTRMRNNRKIFLFTNTISPIISYVIAIVLILKGLYLIALPFGSILSLFIVSIIFWILNRSYFKFKYIRLDYFKELLKIGIPLMPNFIVYWIFGSCDRVMLSNMIGLSETGIYSIGAKLGNASQIIYTAFSGGWLYFAYSTMKDSDQAETNFRVLEYMSAISFFCSSFIFVISRSFYSLVFSGDYTRGFIVAPYLFLCPLLQMLFQIASNQFMVIKKPIYNILILSIGAVSNIVFNLILIPIMGIEGAAIGTLIGYSISLFICLLFLYIKRLMPVSKRFVVSCVVMGLFILVFHFYGFCNSKLSILFFGFYSIFLFYLYFKDIKFIIFKINKR